MTAAAAKADSGLSLTVAVLIAVGLAIVVIAVFVATLRIRFLSEDHERTKNATAAVGSVITTISVAVAAFWVAYSFSATKQRDIAEISLSNARLQNEKLARRGLFDVDLATTQLSDAGMRYVEVSLTFSNAGADEVSVNIKSSKFFFAKVIGTDGGVPHYGPELPVFFQYPDYRITSAEIASGEVTKFNAVQQLPTPGVYLVRFTTDRSDGGEYHDVERFIAVE
jgi:flagellar basal body-associated protein FliL